MQITFDESELAAIIEEHVWRMLNAPDPEKDEITVKFGGYSIDRNCVVTIAKKVLPGLKVEA